MSFNIYLEGKILKDPQNVWTESQQKAILSNLDNTYVSAAAGSGKTAVLTQRILERITNNGLDLDRILVTTFTKSAARDLKK